MTALECLLGEKEKLDELYRKELSTVLDLQGVLLRHIIPDMVPDLGMGEPIQRDFEEWVKDTASVFRTLKYHRFIVPSALNGARETLLRRMELGRTFNTDSIGFIACLPLTSPDPLGRPIIIIKPTVLQAISSSEIQRVLCACMEVLRIRLQQLNSKRDVKEPPVLQYIAVLDMEGTSFRSARWMELLSTFQQQICPIFPGMLAAVFILNYTWHISSAWTFARRLLPPKVLSRVLFVSHEELLGYLTPACLPSDFGGLLCPCSQLENPLRTFLPDQSPLVPVGVDAESPCSSSTVQSSSTDAMRVQRREMVPISSLYAGAHHSPYFGYPVLHDTPTPTLRHGRRRKRDLLRTLAWLFWARWREPIGAAIAAVAVIAILTMSRQFSIGFRMQGHAIAAKLRELIANASYGIG